MSHDLTYLSFGAGVQSTALLCMAALGEKGVPRPGLVVHAQTQSEHEGTDLHMEWVRDFCSKHGLPLVEGTAGSLERAQLGLEASRASGYTVSIPAFTEEGGMLTRQCTRHYKIEVIQRLVREWLGFKPGEVIAGKRRTLSLQGISVDEADRMKPSRVTWIEHAYPLVDAKLARWDCEDWLKSRGLPVPPKSSCVCCPYHSNEHWSLMKREAPKDFARAVAVDESLRTPRAGRQPAFLHSRRLPLAQIDFDAILAEDRAQGRLFSERGGFGNECEGMCGT